MTKERNDADTGFLRALRRAYGGGTATMLALPALALIPAAVEMVQHAVEMGLGMYDGIASAKAVEAHPVRLWTGLLKVASLHLPMYWVARYLAADDTRFAGRWDPGAARRFGGAVVFLVALSALQLFLMPQTPSWLVLALVAGPAVAALTAPWMAGAALGRQDPGPLRSAAAAAPGLGWSLPYLLAVMLPPMVIHYALAAAAITGPRALVWPVLAVDSLLVAWIASVMAAGGWVVAARAMARAGNPLTPVAVSLPPAAAHLAA